MWGFDDWSDETLREEKKYNLFCRSKRWREIACNSYIIDDNWHTSFVQGQYNITYTFGGKSDKIVCATMDFNTWENLHK